MSDRHAIPCSSRSYPMVDLDDRPSRNCHDTETSSTTIANGQERDRSRSIHNGGPVQAPSFVFNWSWLRCQWLINGDFADRLNYQYTIIVSIGCILLIGLRQSIGKQINCATPSEFTQAMQDYSESYCSLSNVQYTGTPHDQLQMSLDHTQWIVPFLVLQLACSWVLGQLIDVYFGYFLRTIYKIDEVGWLPYHLDARSESMARMFDAFMGQVRRVKKGRSTSLAVTSNQPVDEMGTRLEVRPSDCELRKRPSAPPPPYSPSHRITSTISRSRQSASTGAIRYCRQPILSGYRLTCLYVLGKLLQLINGVVQLVLMAKMVDNTSRSTFPLQLLSDLTRGRDWGHLTSLPRLVYCDMKIRKIDKSHMYTFQCLLPNNAFIEKVFILLWFWYCFACAASILSILLWIYRLASHRRFINTCLTTMPQSLIYQNRRQSPCDIDNDTTASERVNKKKLSDFVSSYIQFDGVLSLHLLTTSGACDPTSRDQLVSRLYQDYVKVKKSHQRPQGHDDTDWSNSQVQGRDDWQEQERHFFTAAQRPCDF